MTPERWKQVNDLFLSAAECSPEERTIYLQTACKGDPTLQRDIESLIASHDQAGNFIGSPAFEVAPELLTKERASAMAGELVAHYRIESLLGAGGMGDVYLARDLRLGRQVALKFLPKPLTTDEIQLSRFKREARAASALNHPNILTVHEIGLDEGRHFIATEFVEGTTLRAALAHGKMSVDEVLEVATQVASALAAAHAAGVIHRDIKPENIMLRPDGYVKVLDFGLAKLTEYRSASDDDDLRSPRTQQSAGLVLGTPRYMSPEQARGQTIDAGTDVWSLGVVIYEMLVGTPPFVGQTASDCIASILQTEPAPLSRVIPNIPTQLDSIVQKALRKNKRERYEKIAELLADLRNVTGHLEDRNAASRTRTHWIWTAGVSAVASAVVLVWYFSRPDSRVAQTRAVDSSAASFFASPAPPRIPDKSIAVLPFENRSHDPENAFFTDGVQDEILTDLARIAKLKVISRTSVMPYRTGTQRNLRQIGKELGVAHIVEGSVQRIGHRVRVNAQLIDARTDTHLWAQTYDRELADVFAIQSEIAKAIADQLKTKLSPGEKSAIERAPTADLTAFDLYIRAKIFFETRFFSDAKGNLLRAIALLDQAVDRDSSFFDAYCQLAQAHGVIYFSGYDHTPARLALGEVALQKAFRLRPGAGEAHLARAWNLYYGYLDYEGALSEVEVARQTLPNNSRIFFLKGAIARRQGRWEDSIRNFKRAVDLDPRNAFTLQQLAINYLLLRRYEEERSVLDRALAIIPNDVVTQSERALVEFNSHANTRSIHQLIESVRATRADDLSKIANPWLLCALGERDPVAAKEALNVFGENQPSLSNDNVFLTRHLIEGVIARMTSDDDKARLAFTVARAEQEKIVQAQPTYGPALCVLGLLDAGLGRKEEALREGRRAIELLPIEKDATNGPAMVKYFALIAAWLGDNDLACEQLAIAIHQPGSLTYGHLTLLPFWDPLRGDPRFEKIVASLAPQNSEKVTP